MENFGHSEAKPLDLAAFEMLVAELYDQREKVKSMEEAVDNEKGHLEGLKAKVMTCLDQAGKSNYKSERGTVSVVNKFSVETPKELEAKKAFFEWLEQRGLFDEYATVNSAKLNALYNEHLEISGDPNFKIPGIGEAKHYKQLSIRSK